MKDKHLLTRTWESFKGLFVEQPREVTIPDHESRQRHALHTYLKKYAGFGELSSTIRIFKVVQTITDIFEQLASPVIFINGREKWNASRLPQVSLMPPIYTMQYLFFSSVYIIVATFSCLFTSPMHTTCPVGTIDTSELCVYLSVCAPTMVIIASFPGLCIVYGLKRLIERDGKQHVNCGSDIALPLP